MYEQNVSSLKRAKNLAAARLSVDKKCPEGYTYSERMYTARGVPKETGKVRV